MVHRNDTKQCPNQVKRCESCKRNFATSDYIVIKTTGAREYMNKNGKLMKQVGNVYLHYLTNCLKEHDQKFEFHHISVSKQTQSHLSKDNLRSLKDRGCTLE